MINRNINDLLVPYMLSFKGIDPAAIKMMFWDRVAGRNLGTKNELEEWYAQMVNLIGHFVNFSIICIEKKWNATLQQRFLTDTYYYLQDRMANVLNKISPQFFDNYSSNPPLLHVELLLQSENPSANVIEESDFYDLIVNSSETVATKLGKFRELLERIFPQVMAKCELIAIELGKIETGDEEKYRDNLSELFQLAHVNKYTPPDFVRNILSALYHIHNVISSNGNEEGGIVENSDETFQIIDVNEHGLQTFNQHFPLLKLWDLYYQLLTLDQALYLACLGIDAGRKMAELNAKYIKRVKCVNCRSEYEEFIPPWKPYFYCKRCQKKMYLDKEF
jgi:hypothetical protein